jgi:tRNA A37 threonylcarbamoyladenosine dehydratase
VNFTERSRIVLGDEGLERLSRARVAVYGLGGVGGACAVDLVRAGVGSLVVYDFDVVKESNLNRLAFGYASTVGMPKAEAFKKIAREINPGAVIDARPLFITGAEASLALPESIDAAVEAVDALTPKAMLLKALRESGTPLVTVLGMAGRIEPERIRVGPLGETKGCPLAREVRSRLRRLGVSLDITSVWSDEPPAAPAPPDGDHGGRGRVRMVLGSLPFVPQAAGHVAASLAVRMILGLNPRAK